MIILLRISKGNRSINNMLTITNKNKILLAKEVNAKNKNKNYTCQYTSCASFNILNS